MDRLEAVEDMVIAVKEESDLRNSDIRRHQTSDGQTTIVVYRHYCKGCEICAEVCPDKYKSIEMVKKEL